MNRRRKSAFGAYPVADLCLYLGPHVGLAGTVGQHLRCTSLRAAEEEDKRALVGGSDEARGQLLEARNNATRWPCKQEAQSGT